MLLSGRGIMSKLTEIRWHARAGQGAVTAAKLVADTALMEGAYIQAMPEYGPERTGAPLKAYTRVCDEPIEIHNNITNPDIVVVLDDTLLENVDVTEGLKTGGVIVLNTELSNEEARKLLGVGADTKVATVDASGIAMDTIKRDIKKFSQEVIDANLSSVDRAYEEVSVA